jgi:hypothetical protein
MDQTPNSEVIHEQDWVKGIKYYIAEDLKRFPEFQGQLARVMLRLLSASAGYVNDANAFLTYGGNTLHQLQETLKAKYKKESVRFFESIKAIFTLTLLNSKQREEVKQYLKQLIKEAVVDGAEEVTLEEFLLEKLDIDNDSPKFGLAFGLGTAFDAGVSIVDAMAQAVSPDNLEDFRLYPSKPISDKEIDDLIVEYYQSRGFEVERKDYGLFFKKQGAKYPEFYSHVTNCGDLILISMVLMAT